MKVLLLLSLMFFIQSEGVVMNDRPIIGVLAQEIPDQLQTKEKYTSYIAASYVRNVEAAGARVVPIMIGRNRSYYEDLLGKINGVLFPGGSSLVTQLNGYADAGEYIYEIAKKLNDAGDYFPIFGECLGFEFFIILDSGREEPGNRVYCYCRSNKPLIFAPDYRTSKMFRHAPEDIIDLLSKEDITINAHQLCIVDENLKDYNLTKDWRATSYSYDDYALRFIASIEHTRYPFYGIQFHPEKTLFEWSPFRTYTHTLNAVKANRHFMDFFIKEARRSTHTFENRTEENELLIYNYQTHFTGRTSEGYYQCYFFEPSGNV